MGIHVTAWAYESAELVLDMWAQGYSANQISRVVGYSREAVLGKLFRLRKRGDPRAAKRLADVHRLPKARKAPQLCKPVNVPNVPAIFAEPFDARTVDVEPLLLKMDQLIHRTQCRFICEGEGAEALYCGHKTGGGSWCDEHRALVYYPVQKPMKASKHAWWPR